MKQAAHPRSQTKTLPVNAASIAVVSGMCLFAFSVGDRHGVSLTVLVPCVALVLACLAAYMRNEMKRHGTPFTTNITERSSTTNGMTRLLLGHLLALTWFTVAINGFTQFAALQSWISASLPTSITLATVMVYTLTTTQQLRQLRKA